MSLTFFDWRAHQEVDKGAAQATHLLARAGQCLECLQRVSIFVTPMCGHPSGLNQSVSSQGSASVPAEMTPSVPSALHHGGSPFKPAQALLLYSQTDCL